jgi:hypothetical protein
MVHKSVTHSKCAVSPLERSVRLPCLGKESGLLLSVPYAVGVLGFNAKCNSDHCAVNG